MNWYTSRLLIEAIAALIIGLLVYFFLYKGNEGFANITVSCRKACKSKGPGKNGLKACISKCEFLSYQLKDDRTYWKEGKCGTLKAGPKCSNIKRKLIEFNKKYYRFPM